MGKPANDIGTCIHCGGKLQWKVEEMDPTELAENEVVEKENAAIRDRNQAKREERWAKDDYSWFEAEKFKEIPHRYPPQDPRWTHIPEEPGKNNIPCPGQDEGLRYFDRKNAEPKEYCCERTNIGELCNRRANFESNSGRFYCRQHYEPIKAAEENAFRRDTRSAQREWQAAVAEYKKAELLGYGLQADQIEVRTGYQDEINLVCGIDVILDLLERVKNA